MHTDLPTLIQSIGYLGVWAMIFAESGLLIGFFLPGDSLLFTAGFLASQDLLNLWLLIAGAAIGAVLGDNVGTQQDAAWAHGSFAAQTPGYFTKITWSKPSIFSSVTGARR
jgi:membrane-associated protein